MVAESDQGAFTCELSRNRRGSLGTQSSSKWSNGLLLRNAEQGELEDKAMVARRDKEILELLKAELAFVEQGGYGRSVRTPWLPKSVFQDSLSCINYADPNHTLPCSECDLMNFVSEKDRAESVPCHLIPLNEAGETIADLEAQDNQAKLEANLKQWMRTKINEIEEALAAQAGTTDRSQPPPYGAQLSSELGGRNVISFRTRILLLATAACGVGIGILAPWSDGLYSAMLLFIFPLLVAVAALAIGADLNNTSTKTVEAPPRERDRVPVAKTPFGVTSLRQT